MDFRDTQRWPQLEPYSAEHKRYWEHATRPEAPKVSDGKFILTEEWDAPDTQHMYPFSVPAGFVTDIASIPLGVQALLRTRSDGRIRPAAVAHDWLYATKPCSKKSADLVFREIMEQYGVRLSDVLYHGVMLGGHFAWHRARDVAYIDRLQHLRQVTLFGRG